MKTFVSTTDIVHRYQFLSSEELYREAYPKAFDAVRSQILKFEREQSYREPGKPWDEELQRGNVAAAVEYIPQLIAENINDYAELKQRHIEFVRCRPIRFPATPYLKWEVAAYKETSKRFEKIYWCLYTQLDDIFDKNACHDFMLFDARMAIVQKYDKDGFLRGGWLVYNQYDVIGLISLFGYIKANCLSLDLLESEKLKF